MKHNPIILMTLLLGITFFGCKKQEQEILTPKIKNDKVETTATTATFTWTVDWVGKRISMVELSEHEDMSDPQFYGSEEELDKEDFSATAVDLKPNTKYYYRYLVWNKNYEDNKFEFEVKAFSTNTDLPLVKTLEVIDITRTSATGQGEILSDGGLEITECGICWGTSHNPTTSDSHAASNQNANVYSILIENLNPGETYYVKAYAKNHDGCNYGDEVVFFTEPDQPVVTTTQPTSSSQTTAICGGNVIKDCGAAVTERGICWSTEHNPTINESHSSSGHGLGTFSVSLTGLTAETTYYCKAYAINEIGVSYGDEMQFTTLPEGATGGYFTVDASGKKVLFSKGNLQYRANDGKWRFAEHQYDYIGSDNENISSTYNGYIDLFGWGTSGWDNGNTYYHPWDSDGSDGSLYGPPVSNGLIGNYANSDWGVYNAISNGGNQAGLWHTLSSDEWNYLLYQRQASTLNGVANARFVFVVVCGIQGLVVFPDSYIHPSNVILPNDGAINTAPVPGVCNLYSSSDWDKMQDAGAVFLPGAGFRYHDTQNVVYSSEWGYYWTGGNTYLTNQAIAMGWDFALEIYWSSRRDRSNGLSVRLVRDVE